MPQLFRDSRSIKLGPDHNDNLIIYIEAFHAPKIKALAVDSFIRHIRCDGEGCEDCKPYEVPPRVALETVDGTDAKILRRALAIADARFAACEKIARKA